MSKPPTSSSMSVSPHASVHPPSQDSKHVQGGISSSSQTGGNPPKIVCEQDASVCRDDTHNTIKKLSSALMWWFVAGKVNKYWYLKAGEPFSQFFRKTIFVQTFPSYRLQQLVLPHSSVLRLIQSLPMLKLLAMLCRLMSSTTMLTTLSSNPSQAYKLRDTSLHVWKTPVLECLCTTSGQVDVRADP